MKLGVNMITLQLLGKLETMAPDPLQAAFLAE